MKSVQRTALQLGTFVLLLLASAGSYAQKSVQFEELTFDEAMAKAKKTKKIIFVDVSSAGMNAAGLQAEKEVFTLDSIAGYFKNNVVSIKMNMHSEEGKKFAPRLAMLMYPAYVFYDSNGDQLDFTNAGSVVKNPSLLMEKARSSMGIAKVKMQNKRSIAFASDTWTNLLARAKKENKLIFVDAYTTWCRPCIQMAKDVFTLDKVADYYNAHFINAKMDMEKGDGPALVKKYGVKAYPAFLYVDGDGNLVSQDGGYQEADKFIKAGETAVAKFTAPKAAATSAFIRPSRLMAPGASGNANAVQAPVKEAAPSAIDFSNKNWNAMLAEAKESGKLIFMDAYTTWCGPCKTMRATVFTKQEVGKLFNRNFVNAYIDMEKGEGVDLRTKYEIRAYPTYLFINGDGEVVHKVVGSCPSEEFVQHALDAMSPVKTLKYFAAEYPKKSKDAGFIKDYLKVLSNAYEQKQTDKIALDYLSGLTPAEWEQKDNWSVINDYVKNASSPVFRYVVNNRDKFEKLYGKDAVASKIHFTYLAWPVNYLTFSKTEKAVLDESGYQAFLKEVAADKYEKKDEIIAKSKLTIYSSMRDWDGYVSIVNSMLRDKLTAMNARGAEDLYSYAYAVNNGAKDNKKALQAATSWIKISAENIADVAPHDKITYKELYADLLEKTGDTQLAKSIRESINKEDAKKNTNGAAFQPMMRMTPK